MTTPNPQVRRATVEDLPKLVPLWQQEQLPSAGLEKRFKEFQVVELPAGELAAAVGLEIAGTQGRLHSEVFSHPEESDALRELLWERAQVLARNFGLARLWTQFATPFWNHSGFRHAAAEDLAKLPPSFAGSPAPWQFLTLREESATPVSIEKEFALFKEAEKERTEKMMQQAKVLKVIAALILMAVLLLLALWVFMWFKARNRIPH